MDSNHVLVGLVGSVGSLELRGWDVVEVAVQPLGVEPVDPPEGRELDVFDGAPWSLFGSADQLGLVERVDALGERVVVAVTDAADGGQRAELGESFAVTDAGELRFRIRVTTESFELGAA